MYADNRVYHFGSHVNLWDAGAKENANWHRTCAIGQFWDEPSGQARLLGACKRCTGQTRGRLWQSGAIDHRVPLFRGLSDPEMRLSGERCSIIGASQTCR